ncbi:MAG: PTS mannose transporter subunit IID [Candidatus Dormibacteraeota bacterium]|nr:PTS mannose transporter subunit IID [Candidatus Dormibacteraeota bacterium]
MTARVGLVLVSHSRRLGEGVAELLEQLGGGEVTIEVAAGAEDGSLGTDVAAVERAIERACGVEGGSAVVLVDVGSAVLSTDAARELLPPTLVERVRVADAPFVEGAVAAVVEAGLGRSLEDVLAAAESARQARKL